MPDLTEKFIASLKPREGRKQYDVYDSKLPLGLCYSNGGARTFFVFWRDVEGKNRRTSIGRHDQGMLVREARRVAKERLGEIAGSAAVSPRAEVSGRGRPTAKCVFSIDYCLHALSD